MGEKKLARVTYSYDGKILPVKEPHLNDMKIISPHINIQNGPGRSLGINSSMTERTVSTR